MSSFVPLAPHHEPHRRGISVEEIRVLRAQGHVIEARSFVAKRKSTGALVASVKVALSKGPGISLFDRTRASVKVEVKDVSLRFGDGTPFKPRAKLDTIGFEVGGEGVGPTVYDFNLATGPGAAAAASRATDYTVHFKARVDGSDWVALEDRGMVIRTS